MVDPINSWLMSSQMIIWVKVSNSSCTLCRLKNGTGGPGKGLTGFLFSSIKWPFSCLQNIRSLFFSKDRESIFSRRYPFLLLCPQSCRVCCVETRCCSMSKENYLFSWKSVGLSGKKSQVSRALFIQCVGSSFNFHEPFIGLKEISNTVIIKLFQRWQQIRYFCHFI